MNQSSEPLDARAERCAAELLSSLGNRWSHVQRVAHRAGSLAAAWNPEDRDLLVATAWLHDIGYAPGVVRTGFHALDGARYLSVEGFPNRLVGLVGHHSAAVYEAEERGLSAELAVYEREDGPVMDALVYADMTTGPAGQAFTFEERIEEILTRYAPDTPVHRAITRAQPYLTGCVERALARFEAAYPT